MVAFPVMFVYFIIPSITVERYHVLYFALYGSPDPSNRNKDKFGRLRSVCH